MAAGWRSILPYRLGMTLGGGTIVPVAPASTTAVSNRSLVGSLDISREITNIRTGDFAKNRPADQNLAKALTAIQGWTNTSDRRLREVSGSLNSVGLSRDLAGNVAVQAATFTVSLATQTFALLGNDVFVSAPSAPPDFALIPNNGMSWHVDQGGNQLTFHVRKEDGTLLSVSLLLS